MSAQQPVQQPVPVHIVGVPFDDTILVTQPFNGTVAMGQAVIKAIGGVGNIMRLDDFADFVYHIFYAPPAASGMATMEDAIRTDHPHLSVEFNRMPGVQPSAFIVEEKGAPSRQSVVYGAFDFASKLTPPQSAIVQISYLENTPCLVGKAKGALYIGDFNNSMVCEEAVRHNVPLLDILLLSIDEVSAYKSKIGFDLLRNGCYIVAHEPRRVVVSRIDNGRPVELARLENQHFIPQVSNVTGNGDVFSGYLLRFFSENYAPGTELSENLLDAAIRHAQKATSRWLESYAIPTMRSRAVGELHVG